MKKDWIIALLKLIVVLLLFFGPAVIIRKMPSDSEISTHISPANDSTKEQYYFLGSSRTMYSINDSILSNRFNTANFTNIGMSGCTFLFNKALADKLLISNGRKTLFIEASVINARVPAAYRFVLDNSEVFHSVFPLMKKVGVEDFRHIFYPVLERITLSKTRLGPELKASLHPETMNKQIGYLGSGKTVQEISPWFFNERDSLYTGKNIHRLYGLIVNDLINKARQTGSRVIFYISPVTSNKAEKEVLTAVFNMIPPENKIHYEQSFLNKLNDPALFSDPTHLNSAGAILFTNYLAEQIHHRHW